MKKFTININIERWLLSSNAKDIGVLYLIFALFSVLFFGINLFGLVEIGGFVGIQYIFANSFIIQYCSLLPITTTGLNPWYVTGFIDAEGSFGIYPRKDKSYKTGYLIQPNFQKVYIKMIML